MNKLGGCNSKTSTLALCAGNLANPCGYDTEDEELETFPTKKCSSKQIQPKIQRISQIQKPASRNPIVYSHMGKFNKDVIEKTQSANQNREHSFKTLWDRNNFMPIDLKSQFEPTVPYSTSQNWKQWPPPIPQMPHGLKIPIQFSPHIEYDLPVCGIPSQVEFGIDAHPIPQAPLDFYSNLNGLLNSPKANSFSVFPPSLLFVKAQVGQRHSALLKIRNDGDLPRRVCVLRPFNKAFDVIWGAELNEEVMIPPGLTARVWILFKPTSTEPINDILTIIVHGDGALVVPMMVASADPPILEMDEWDCGCSTLGKSRVSHFEINNLGGTGRFWILTELDYEREYIVLHKEKETANQDDTADTATDQEIRGPSPDGAKKEHVKMDHLFVKPFKVYPACFRLQKNQQISIKARYRPTDANFHYRKLALLCDNGQVRWIAIRGIGIDPKKHKLVQVTGDWAGPPCDLPTDLSTKLIMDCGNLLAGEFARPRYKIINNSCIPVYFFWSVRPILSAEGSSVVPLERNFMQHFLEGSMPTSTEWRDYYDELSQTKATTPVVPLKVIPAQGILDSNEAIECEVQAECPNIRGYHACIISLFAQQVEENARPVLSAMIHDLTSQNLNSIPIYYEELVESMRREFEIETPPPDLGTGSIESTTKKHRNRHKHKKHLKAPTKLFLPISMFHTHMTGMTGLDFHEAAGTSTRETREHSWPSSTGSGDHRRKTLLTGDEIIFDHKHSALESTWKIRGSEMPHQICTCDPCECDVPPPAKEWLTAESALLPDSEIELWFRNVSLKCCINPPFFVGSGYAASTMQRKFSFHNQSEHSITVEWDPVVQEIYSVLITPKKFRVAPNHIFVFSMTVHLQKCGKVSENIPGILTLPFQSVSCALPIHLEVFGPSIELLTPIIDFGIVAIGAEKTMTFGLKNTGNQRVTWRAKISPEVMRKGKECPDPNLDENEEDLIAHQFKMNSMVRVWPEWGVLEHDETAGGQIFFTAEHHGKLTMTVEVWTNENPNISLFIPIFGEVQSQSLVLQQGRIIVRDIFPYIPCNECYTVTLINPTAFLVPFSWQDPVGPQRDICTIEFEPKFGVVKPKRCITCKIMILAEKQAILNNLFIPCCVEGMKEPLLLQIEGQISGLLVAFIMPDTPKNELDQDDTYDAMFNERWSLIFKGNQQGVKFSSGMHNVNSGEGDVHLDELGEDGGMDWYRAIQGGDLPTERYGESGGFVVTGAGSDINVTSTGSSTEVGAKKGKKKSKRKATITIADDNDNDLKGKKKGKKKGKGGKGRRPSSAQNLDNEIPQFDDADHDSPELVISADKDVRLSITSKEKSADKDVRLSITSKEKSVETENSVELKDKSLELGNKSVELKENSIELRDKSIDMSTLENRNSSKGKIKKKKKSIVGQTPSARIGSTDIHEHLRAFGGSWEETGELEFPGEGFDRFAVRRSLSSPLMAGKEGSFLDDIDIQPTSPLGDEKKLLRFPVTRIGLKKVEEGFLIQNHSPVRAAFTLTAAKYDVESFTEKRMSTIDNLIAKRMKSHSPSDFEVQMTAAKLGIAFEVIPKDGTLEPYSVLRVKIRVHANLWGIYEDELLCKFDGIAEPYIVYLEALVTGCPISFRLAPSPPVVIRFGNGGAIESPDIIREVLMKNNASCPIGIGWHTLEFSPCRKKAIDSTFLRELSSKTPAPYVPPNSPNCRYRNEEFGEEFSGEFCEEFRGEEEIQQHIQSHSNYELYLDAEKFKVNPRKITIPAKARMEVPFVFFPEKALQHSDLLFGDEPPRASFKGLALARLHLDKDLRQDYGPEAPFPPGSGLHPGIGATWVDVNKMDVQDNNGVLLFASPATITLPTCPRNKINLDDHRLNRSYFEKQCQKKMILMSRYLSLENVSQCDVSVELTVDTPFSMTTERRQVSQQKIDSLIIFRESFVRVIIDLKLTRAEVDEAIEQVLGHQHGMPVEYKQFFSTTEISFQRIMWPGDDGYYFPSMDNSVAKNTTCISVESLLQIIHPSGTMQMVIMEGWLHLPQVVSLPRVINFKSKFIKQIKSAIIKLYNMTEGPLPIKIKQFYTTLSGHVKLVNESNKHNCGFEMNSLPEIILPTSRDMVDNDHRHTAITINFCPKEFGQYRSFWLIQNSKDEELCVLETYGIGH